MRNTPIGWFPTVLNVTVMVGFIVGFIVGSMYVPHFFLALPAYFAVCAVGKAVWDGWRERVNAHVIDHRPREAGGEERIVSRRRVAIHDGA